MDKEFIDKIPAGNYEGYYWMSDATEPVVISSENSHKVGNNAVRTLPEALLTPNPYDNPFVVEAQLFDTDNRISYGVKYIDGEYIITRHKVEEDIKDVEKGKYDHITFKRYYANRMPGIELMFFQYWTEQKDELCAGFPVLQPAEMAFVGFNSNINKAK